MILYSAQANPELSTSVPLLVSRDVEANCCGTLHFPAYSGLHHAFCVCQTPVCSLDFSSRKTKKYIFTDSCALSLCIISVSPPRDPVGRDHDCYYFHCTDEDTEAQRLLCSFPANKWQSQTWNPGPPVPGPHLAVSFVE